MFTGPLDSLAFPSTMHWVKTPFKQSPAALTWRYKSAPIADVAKENKGYIFLIYFYYSVYSIKIYGVYWKIDEYSLDLK